MPGGIALAHGGSDGARPDADTGGKIADGLNIKQHGPYSYFIWTEM